MKKSNTNNYQYELAVFEAYVAKHPECKVLFDAFSKMIEYNGKNCDILCKCYINDDFCIGAEYKNPIVALDKKYTENNGLNYLDGTPPVILINNNAVSHFAKQRIDFSQVEITYQSYNFTLINGDENIEELRKNSEYNNDFDCLRVCFTCEDIVGFDMKFCIYKD